MSGEVDHFARNCNKTFLIRKKSFSVSLSFCLIDSLSFDSSSTFVTLNIEIFKFSREPIKLLTDNHK